MEAATPSFNENDIRAQLAKAKYDQKWDVLKPVIKKLWMEDDRKLSELMKDIQASYCFTAQESQYKYHIRKWKWKRNISTSKKEALCKIRSTRAEAGRSTHFEYQGKTVDEKKLRRQMKDNMRKGSAMLRPANNEMDWKAITGSAFKFGNSILLNWTRPYGTGQRPACVASSPMSMSTPSDVVVRTPPANNAPSPSDAPSPFAQIAQKSKAVNRAYMLVEGQHAVLVNSMGREERETMSTWLYQFWVYAFKTAKYWGRGPRDWTLDLLRFEQFKTAGLVQSPRSPVTNFETMVRQHFHSVMPQSARRSLDETSLIAKPSPLCRWSIHYSNNMKYEACKTRTPSPERDRDPLDEAAWRPWPSSDINPSMSQKLTVGLGSNHFSDVAAEDLPISLKKVARTLETADENFLEETLGFSIMARNFDMVGEILADWYERHCDKPMEHSETLERIRSVMPYHLAVTYLDGSKACCKVLDTLMDFNLNIRARDTNKFGHTVFDCLMMTILKAHTKVTPGELDDSLRDEKSFPGEEVDICGRFDADSDNVRALVASGQSGIPFSWKHKFCHTSTQAICHCLQTSAKKSILIDDDMITDVPSGLFVKRCLYCGLKMQLLPLHTLVLVAFQLGQSGAKDEDLFGIIAILLCILRLDADPLKTADVSMAALFPGEGSEEADLMGCSHSPLRACQIVALAWRHVDKWSSKAKTGWAIFFHILRIAEHTWSNEYELTDHECESYERECYKGKCFEYESDACLGRDKLSKDAQLLGLWAAVQTEILTYRRLREEDPWVSPFFDMLSVLRSLETGEPLVIELIRKDMIKPLCEHGWFHSRDPWCPRAEDVMKYHFSNLEDWFRTTFIRLSDLDLGEALFCFEERKQRAIEDAESDF